MKILFKSGEGKPRQPRSDKRVRSTLRLKLKTHDNIKAIAYNHNLSKQKVIDAILEMVIGNDVLRYRLTSSFKREYGQKVAYLNITE